MPLLASHARNDSARRVLVVDDNLLNLRLAYEILGSQYQVFAATTGQQALDFCAANPPDLILLDVVMAGMDGLETCRRLQVNPATRAIPVIFVTGGTQDGDEEACWQAGGVDFVSKPVSATTLRNRVRVHMTLKEQSDQLRQLAFIDGLTGLSNRRYFDERYETDWRRARRQSAHLSVIALDVDYFKRFNDRYGHPAGDACLQKLAQVMRHCLARPADLCARYGGEEFMCLLPDTPPDGALALADKLAQGIAALALPHRNGTASEIVTASMGVASCVPRDGLTPAALTSLADTMLYEAKAGGRACARGAALEESCNAPDSVVS